MLLDRVRGQHCRLRALAPISPMRGGGRAGCARSAIAAAGRL